MGLPKRPVTIRGVAYESVTHAAKALQVTHGAVQHAIRRGRLDAVGLGQSLQPDQAKPVTIRGTRYASHADAARALGLTAGAISESIKRNALDRVGMTAAGKGLPVVMDGKKYPTAAAASRATGVPYNSVIHLAREQNGLRV